MALAGHAQAKTPTANQPGELGQVRWHRDYEAATTLARQQGKAVLVLFQEVPGCATCRNYGRDVLSHPLMVEAIEGLFVPLAIYNNKGGKDRQVLARFNEPSWNNPVVRIVDADGNGLARRVAGNYTAMGLYDAMADALFRQGTPMPPYMAMLKAALAPPNDAHTAAAYFKMYCFWSGERHMGAAPGVVATEPGFADGHEVVKVWYDTQATSAKRLAAHARQAQCAPMRPEGGYRAAQKDHYYYLRQSSYRFLPLTRLQKTKINSALGHGQPAHDLLSPRQRAWLAQVAKPGAKRKDLLGQGLRQGWQAMEALYPRAL